MKTETLHDLYIRELRDLYGAEKLLVSSLPKLIEKARLPELRQILEAHFTETRNHVSRLEQIFQMHTQKPEAKRGKILEGILAEMDDDLANTASPLVRDAAIIAAAQQVEHYEIATYGTLHSYAQHLGYREAAHLLENTLEEERTADKNLSAIAESRVNLEAARAA